MKKNNLIFFLTTQISYETNQTLCSHFACVCVCLLACLLVVSELRLLPELALLLLHIRTLSSLVLFLLLNQKKIHHQVGGSLIAFSGENKLSAGEGDHHHQQKRAERLRDKERKENVQNN